MKSKRKIYLILISAFIILQFFRPSPNEGNSTGVNSIQVSPGVKNIFETSCYDCHSNYTNYPWYANIQPIGWWINNHVKEGKHELNFSEFNTYSLKRKLHKLKEIKEELEDEEMPLDSYTFIHYDAKLSPEEKNLILNWVDETAGNLTDTTSR